MKTNYAVVNYNDAGRDVSSVLVVSGINLNYETGEVVITAKEFPALEEISTGVEGRSRVAFLKVENLSAALVRQFDQFEDLVWEDLSKAPLLPHFELKTETGRRQMEMRSVSDLGGEIKSLGKGRKTAARGVKNKEGSAPGDVN